MSDRDYYRGALRTIRRRGIHFDLQWRQARAFSSVPDRAWVCVDSRNARCFACRMPYARRVHREKADLNEYRYEQRDERQAQRELDG